GWRRPVRAMRIMTLERIRSEAASITSPFFVAEGAGLVAAGLDVVLHPIVSGRTPDQIESILAHREQNRIADDVAVVIARYELLRLIRLEVLKAVDAQIGEHF